MVKRVDFPGAIIITCHPSHPPLHQLPAAIPWLQLGWLCGSLGFGAVEDLYDMIKFIYVQRVSNWPPLTYM